ncbi:MAG: pilus assembly protein [Nitrosomonadales bacterium]|nr:pilus assembly protein [Nitrosomonadales bacterium]
MDSYRQRGATLVVGLVMLVVLTLLVLSAIRSGNVNMRIVGNMQAQEETANASVQAIEEVISTNFTADPSAVSAVIAVDINNDGEADYDANITTPVCKANLAVTNANLDPANPADASCISSAAARDTGLRDMRKAAVVTGQSWCYQQEWEVRAQVTDDRTGATAASRQGVSLRVPAGTVCP